MSALHPGNYLTLDFRDVRDCISRAREFHSRSPIHAVIPVDEETAIAAAAIGGALSLKHNSIESAQAARDKFRLSELLRARSVQSPQSSLRSLGDSSELLAGRALYPCVLKPLFLSASRGVIRTDNPAEYVAAWKRIRAILETGEAIAHGGAATGYILEQEYVPGAEFALEGLLDGGRLRVLAIFDKPDPLVGPFFEETIYVTPSRAPAEDQAAIARCAADAAQAIGLREGPVHAELRLNSRGAWLIEIAARSIGGLCSRTLKFGTGLSLEDLVLRHALGIGVEQANREQQAAGVMMIPIPGRGILEEVEGLEKARKVPGVAEVTITARPGNRLIPLPEGSSYLGFIFGRGNTPGEVEAALRAAHATLRFAIVSEEASRGTGTPGLMPKSDQDREVQPHR